MDIAASYYRISRHEAENLMGAPSFAGGWIGVDVELADALIDALRIDDIEDDRVFLAAFPANAFPLHRHTPVSADEIAKIRAVLDRLAKLWSARRGYEWVGKKYRSLSARLA